MQTLQQLSQTINVGLNGSGGDIASRARATDHQRVIAVPAAFDGEDVVAWQERRQRMFRTHRLHAPRALYRSPRSAPRNAAPAPSR